MKHWRIDDVSWDKFDASQVDPEIVPLVKAAAMVERNGTDYAVYLRSVFRNDAAFGEASDNWAIEEVQHGDALGRWAQLADPSWDYMGAFARYQNGYKLQLDAETSIRGSLTGELVARCMVETGTSSYYTALAEASTEPVLQQVCRLIAADEYRHFKLFYDHMRRYLTRENISVFKRLWIAASRITESEDDELAYAFHCGNEPLDLPYAHERCIAAYMGTAMKYYRLRHIERGMGMVLKTVGLPPRGRLSDISAKIAWRLLQNRRRKFQAAGTKAPPAINPHRAAA